MSMPVGETLTAIHRQGGREGRLVEIAINEKGFFSMACKCDGEIGADSAFTITSGCASNQQSLQRTAVLRVSESSCNCSKLLSRQTVWIRPRNQPSLRGSRDLELADVIQLCRIGSQRHYQLRAIGSGVAVLETRIG